MTDIANDLENIKISLLGYDKEQILLYLKEVLQQCEEEKQKEMSQLLEQNQKLQMQCAQAKEMQNQLQQQYDRLLKQMQEMTAVLGQSMQYGNRQEKKPALYGKQSHTITEIKSQISRMIAERKKPVRK